MKAAVVRHLSTPDVAFALPLAGDNRWYRPLAIDPLTTETRAELGASLADLAQLVQALRAEAPGRPLALAGFSQGACLSLEHAFTGKAAPDAVVAFTGCRVGATLDARPSALPAGLPVYLTGGSNDPWIPVSAFAEAAAELGRGEAALRMDVFPGRPHEVSAPEIAMLDAVLTDLAAGRAPRFEVPR
jgi:phospholipase/carboxylesterase